MIRLSLIIVATAMLLSACGDPEPVTTSEVPSEPASAAEHAVITHLPLSGGDYGSRRERRAVQKFEDRIERAVAAIGGEHDGNEFGGGEAVLYTYGPDADALFQAIRNSLGRFTPQEGAYAIKRYGAADDPNARDERVPLP